MKKNDLISIVVPVYNVSKYLKKCVDSLVTQTYKNIEIILVNDGSTDDSGQLCDKLAKLDEKIKVFHKKNGGLSDARNYGTEKAKGKYVCYVDSDDYVTPDMCEILYTDIIEYDADVAFCAFTDCYYGDESIIVNENVKRSKLTKEEAIKYVMIGDTPMTAVAKLYKKDLFNSVKFEKGKTYEDALIMVELLDKCNAVSFNSSSVYYYVHRKNSITTTKFNEKKDYDVIYAYEKNKRIIDEKYPRLVDVATMRLCWAHFRVLDTMIKLKCEVDKKIVNYLRNNYSSIMESKYFTKSRKLSMFFLKRSIVLYKIIIKLTSKKFVG